MKNRTKFTICKITRLLIPALIAFSVLAAFHPLEASAKKLVVVATLTDYASIAREIGKDKITAAAIAKGDEDAHFVRPKPSFAERLAKADVFITTGLDLEMWAPAVVDKSGNSGIREGQIGYISVYDGIKLLEIPSAADRSQGGVHIYGNPHINSSPLNYKHVAKNIAIGLKKIDPKNGKFYEKNYKAFIKKMDEKLFGNALVAKLGGDTLTRLAQTGNLIAFLEKKSYKGTKLIDMLGGWMKKALPLRGKKIVTYHKNWIYFAKLFGLDVIGEVEPKPAIPPSPKDVEKLLEMMKRNKIKVVLAANYFDENKVKMICKQVKARPVIVPMHVGGVPEVKTYFQLVDYWLDNLVRAYGEP